jgi:arabinose-5-phosphate isomerase
MGDAMASVLIKLRDFKPENFAVYHPGGSLGRRLLMKVEDVMHKGDEVAVCTSKATVDEVLLKMTNKRLGAVCVVDNGKMSGIITEGDIRRALKEKNKFFDFYAGDLMTKEFTSIDKEKMAIDALELMENRESQISVLPVIEGEELVGLVRVHDLLKVVG